MEEEDLRVAILITAIFAFVMGLQIVRIFFTS